MLGRFHSLLPEIIEFRNLKKCLWTKLEDENWLCDLGFMVDVTKYLNDLNVQLQGSDQLLHSMFFKSKSFTSILSLWENQFKDNECTHFPTLKKYNPTFCAEYLWNVPVSWKASMLDFRISKASSWSLISFLSSSMLQYTCFRTL